MAHNTNYSHNLASLDPKLPMDPPTIEKKKYPIYHPSTSKNTSIHSISNNFSKLYTNHKILSTLRQTDQIIHPHPQPQPPMSSSNLDSSCTTLTKSKSQHGGRYGTRTNVVKERVLVKLPKEEDETTQKEWKTKELVEEKIKKQDVKKGQALMCRSYGEGFDGVKMQSFSRRKSFCSSKMELADFFLCSGVKLVAVDMPPYMQIHAVDCARKAHDSLEKFTARTLACTLKREFDGEYGPAWHCIVGTSFGSFVTHSVGGFMYFSMDQKLYILLFKTTVQKAE